MEARKLFRTHATTGQPGELLVYFLIEAVLQAPQVLKKMPITTNPNEERKGSDGVHARWGAGQLLEVMFAEAKLYEDFDAALGAAFKSMTEFHDSATKDLEINYFLNTYTVLDPEQRKLISSYVEGENRDKCQQAHVCLIGYDWQEYGHLKSATEKEKFLQEFEQRYLAWAREEMAPALRAELRKFKHAHLKFEFFFLPFTSVDNFRQLFLGAL